MVSRKVGGRKVLLKTLNEELERKYKRLRQFEDSVEVIMANLEGIFSRISFGQTLNFVAEKIGFKPWAFYQLLDVNDEVKVRYLEAKRKQMESWEDYIVDRAYDTERDIFYETAEKLNEDGEIIARVAKPRSDNTAVLRDRLIIDTLRWLMIKNNPAKYSDKIRAELSGNISVTPVINLLSKQVNGECDGGIQVIEGKSFDKLESRPLKTLEQMVEVEIGEGMSSEFEALAKADPGDSD